MKKTILLVLTILGIAAVILSLSKDAEAFKLPDTGQTKCYDGAGSVINPCPKPGQSLAQDGSYSINPMSFTIVGSDSDMLQDTNTGLIWQRQDDGNTHTWASDICGSLNIGGYGDWRLPSKKELVSIVDYSKSSGPLISHMFSFPHSSLYWTSTNYSSSLWDVWQVHFSMGTVMRQAKDGNAYVRCVRGGQIAGSLTDNGNGTVTDNRTGLIWQQEEPGQMGWQIALNYCEGLNLADKSDWRLPNIKELESLTDDWYTQPSIDTDYFPNTPSAAAYWSSTSWAASPSRVFQVNFVDAYIENAAKSNTYEFVRCVRGGQSESLGYLTISKSGQGSGTVTSSPEGISCGLICEASYPLNSIVSLSAAPDTGGSIFSGWGGDSDCTDGSMLMNGDKSCSATFTLCQGAPVSVGGAPYAWINSACTAAGASDTIKLMGVNHQEVVNLASDKIIKLEGGYDCSFTTKATQTTISGSLTISSGTVELDGIVIL